MIKRLKYLARKKIPPWFYVLYNYHNDNKLIQNYFNKNYSKKALLTYITEPFTHKNSFIHTNYFEAESWAKILDELNFNVDIVRFSYSKPVAFSEYDLLCGFGDLFQRYFETANASLKTIYYGTGMHVNHQNHATLQRVKDVHKKKGVWLGKSARYVEKSWTHQTFLVDGIITLDGGNKKAIESYAKFYNGSIYAIPAPTYKILDGYTIIKTRTESNKRNFLWFGGRGLIHKGLDLALDYFATRSDLNLHICGSLEKEPDFVNAYKKELTSYPNIKVHGFVDITSEEFKKILEECDFVINPSCSEGGSPSTYNVIINGGLIPLVTKETTVSTGYEIMIPELTVEGVASAIDKAAALDQNEVVGLRKANLKHTLNMHTQEKYYESLKSAIASIIS